MTSDDKFSSEQNAAGAAEDQLRLITDAVPVLISYVDKTGRYVFNNRTYEEWFGIRREQIKGKHASEILGKTAWKKVRRHFDDCLSGRRVEFEDLVSYRKGGRRWVNVSYIPHCDEQNEVLGVIVLATDITERKKSEERLRKSEEQFRLLFEKSRDAILIADDDGNFLDVNEAACEIFGYPREQMLNMKVSDLITPKKNKAGQMYRRYLKKGAETGEFEFIRPDGVRRIAQYSASRFAENRHMSILRDITVQKQLQQNLRESEKKYRVLFEKNPLPVWVQDAETLDILAVNKAAVRLYGYSRAEFLRMNAVEIWPPEDVSQYLMLIEEIKNKETVFLIPLRHRKKNGEIIDVEITSHKFNFKGRAARYVTAHDVTERNRLAKKLTRERQEKTDLLGILSEKNQLLEQTFDAIFIWHIDDGIVYWHPNSERLYGYTRSEALGVAPDKLLKTFYPMPHDDFIAELKQRGYWEGEFAHITKSGEEVIAECRLQVIQREENQLVVLETLHDITERRQVEAKLSRAAQLSLVGELAAGLAHEIKNPLAGIQGVIDILLQRRTAENAGPDEEREILESVRHEIERIDKTVRALLQHARPKPLEFRIAPLDETVCRGLQFAALQGGTRNSRREKISTELKLPGSQMLVPHDPAKIEDAVLNLILNARDAIGNKKTGRITIRLSSVGSESGNERLAVIEVTDNGCGIPPEKLDRVFTPFQTTKEDGTGLGLAAVKRIVRAHGGDCRVRSTPGKGSTFTIRLPFKST